MAHELAPPSYDATVGAEKRRSDNTFEIRSFSDPFGRIKNPPFYTRSQSTPDRSSTQEYSERPRPSRNRRGRLRDVTIDEDEVFEKPSETSRGHSQKHDGHSYRPKRAQSLRQDVRPRRVERGQDERPRKDYEDLRRNDDRQRTSFEDLRHVDEHQRSSFDDLRRPKRSYEDLSPRSRNPTYSAGRLKSTSDDIHNGSPTKASSGESLRNTPNAINRSISSPGESQYSLGRAPKRNPLKSSSGDSRQSLGNSSNGTSTLRSSSGDSPYSFANTSNENGRASKSSVTGDSRYSFGANSPTGGITPVKSQPNDYRYPEGHASHHTAPFHPYCSEEWHTQSGHPFSLEASDTQTEDYSSYASTLEKAINSDRKSVNNNIEYDDFRYGAWGACGSLEKTYQKPKIRDKPVNLVKPSIPVKPLIPPKTRIELAERESPSILKSAYRIDNMPSTPVKGASAEFEFDYDPVKTAFNVHLQNELDSDPLKVYTQFQTSVAHKPRDGVIFDPAKLQTQLSETGSETGLSGTLRSNATNASQASRASNLTEKSLDHYRQDYRCLDLLRSIGGETHSVASSDDSAPKTTSDCALERVERIAEKNRNNRITRSRIKRLGCGIAQIVIGLLLIGNAVFILWNESQGWFTCAGFWAGIFAAIGGSLGILTHCNPKDVVVNIMIGVTMFNICLIYLGTFCIGLSFGLVQMEKGGIHVWLDALNFVYILLSLLGIGASVLQMSPVEKQSELSELEFAKSFVDWKALGVKPPAIDRTPSTSSSQGSQERDGYRNYGYESSNYGDAVTTV